MNKRVTYQISTAFLLMVSLTVHAAEDQQRLNDVINEPEVSGLSRNSGLVGVDGSFTFQYRSAMNYNESSYTRPLKQLVDCCFCENRNSLCIRGGNDPKVCGSYCVSLGIVGSALGSLAKIFTVVTFLDPQNMDRSWCSRLACDFSWFPSCSQHFNCGDTPMTDSGIDSCGQCMAWGSSASLISACTLVACLIAKKCLHEKGKNEGPNY
jgi:hypothetical protein